MEPLFVKEETPVENDTMSVEQEEEPPQINTTNEDNTVLMKNIDSLYKNIYKFKKQLFDNLVNKSTHSPSNMEAMKEFHSLYLQCVGYWISCLETCRSCVPEISDPSQKEVFETLTNKIRKIGKSSSDANILVYNMLFQISLQHPFSLTAKTSKL